MTIHTEYDIMIVGGGPAGISTWLHLHKYAPELAAKTVLIEKEQYPRDKLCGGAAGGWTEEIFKYLDIDLNIPSLWISTVEVRCSDEIYVHKQQNFFRMIQRVDFDQYLAKIAVDRGLNLHENETFLDMLRKENYLIVKTNRRKYKIRSLIAADGALSRVRHCMQPFKKPRFARTLEIFLPVSEYDSEYFKKMITIDFSYVLEGLQGYVWHFPCIYKNQPFMNYGIGDFRINPTKKRVNLKKIFSHDLEMRNILINTKSWRSHPITIYEKDCALSQPNILLTGDAAGIDSAIGGGIHLALSYGDIASKEIVEAFQNDNFSFNNYTCRFQNHLLGKYIQKLNRLSKEMYEDHTKILPIIQEIFSKKKTA